MELIVGQIDESGVIHTGNDVIPYQIGWRFHPITGFEIDEDLEWDGITKTGSYLQI